MFTSKLFAASLVLQAALHPQFEKPPPQLPTYQQNIRALDAAIYRTTHCVAAAVAESRSTAPLTDKIVEAFQLCYSIAKNIPQAYDALFGDGGEEFFMGKFLDDLPAEVVRFLRAAGHK